MLLRLVALLSSNMPARASLEMSELTAQEGE